MRPRGGFTLLEVLIALAIVGIALAALVDGIGFGLGAVDRAGRYEEAVSRARSHLAAAGIDVDALKGVHTGDDGGGFRWTIDIRPFTVKESAQTQAADAKLPTLYTVAVTISWRDGTRQRSVTLRSERLGAPRQ